MKEQVLNKEEPLSSQDPKKIIYVEMFRAGPQISSTGQKMVFTESDLEQVISTYKPENHEAPLIIGHDQNDGTPALGWVKDVWRKGKELWGKVELTPKAEKLIRNGVFKKVSSSFYLPDADTNPTPGKLALRHLGLVSIPAVKGLSAFSEQIGEEKIFTSTPSEGESSISFKENLETDTVMARKRTKKETPVSVSEYTEGGMTVNINIGKEESGAAAAHVYDDSGNEISETGAPADYEMDYAADEETSEEDASAPEASATEESSDDLGLEEKEGEEEMPSEEGKEEMPSEEPSMETEDVSDDMEDGDKKVASLAAEYTEDELFDALSLKKKAASMMEGGSDSMSSYGEMPEGLKKHMEEKGDGEEKKEEDEDEEKKTEDMGEETAPSADDETEVSDNGEGCKDYEEDEEKKEEEEKKSDMSEEKASSEATGTLEHSEEAMGVQGNELETRVAELEEELARHKKMIREKEISDFCEGVYGSGKLTEQIVSKTDLVRFMETLNSKNTVNFSESGKASQYDFFKGVLESLPSMVSFEELATPASEPKKSVKQVAPSADGYVYDPSTADLHAQALEYSEEKGCDYLTAVKDLISHS